ncbi:MAG: trypsin-like peptidase domain-containing protein [Deinococcus sp.]|nr:trypsin-like peptidase domain-containing protein [Deinococcus sp.]MCL5964467.1 trypsin-like peptidase domain-containing protein [Deinococcus sp.]
MATRSSALGFGALLVIAGAVLWWGISQSQPPSAPPAVAPIQENRALLENESNTIEVVQKMGDGVVYVSTHTNPAPRGQVPEGFELFAPFFEMPAPREGTGSGFVIDANGYILTNNHVVDGADQITVKFHNDPKEYSAKVVGTARALDIALIKVQAPRERLKPMVLGDSDSVKVGQKAIAMGNPFGLEFTVTEGIVSAVRSNQGAVETLVPTVIQTDAAINPGNSGGPLINSRGEVIGINTSIASSSGQSSGVGFAIPINLAKQYLPDLKAGKNLSGSEVRRSLPLSPEVASRPRIGVEIADLAAYPASVRARYNLPSAGVMITGVQQGSPAARVGLKGASKTVVFSVPGGQEAELGIDGDIVLEADGQKIISARQLADIISSKKSGQAVNLKILRDGRQLSIRVVPQVLR